MCADCRLLNLNSFICLNFFSDFYFHLFYLCVFGVMYIAHLCSLSFFSSNWKESLSFLLIHCFEIESNPVQKHLRIRCCTRFHSDTLYLRESNKYKWIQNSVFVIFLSFFVFFWHFFVFFLTFSVFFGQFRFFLKAFGRPSAHFAWFTINRRKPFSKGKQ